MCKIPSSPVLLSKLSTYSVPFAITVTLIGSLDNPLPLLVKLM